jgi:hypothetical protein
VESIQAEVAQIVVYGVDNVLARASVWPRTITAAARTDFCHDDKIVRIRMERLLDELIGYVWPVVIAGVDVIDSRGHGFPEDSDRTGNIARRTPNNFIAVLPGELHCPITHAVYRDRTIRKGKCTAKVRAFSHMSPFDAAKAR